MSENLLQLIPQQPTYVPSEEAVLRAEQFLKSHISETGKVYSEVSNEIRFIDAGANFESVSCPVCGKKISGEWSAAMDEAHKSQFSNLELVAPCCDSRTTLNHLNYNFPQGFARFVLSARDPGVKMRVIWTHY